MHKSLVSRPLSDLYALKTKKKMKTKALLKGAFVFTSWTKFYLLYENTIVRLRLVFIWRFIFDERRRLLQSQKILAPFLLKKISRTGHMTFSVYVCAKERGWRELKLHLPKANKCTYSRDLYLYKSGQICRRFLFTPLFCNTVENSAWTRTKVNTTGDLG